MSKKWPEVPYYIRLTCGLSKINSVSVEGVDNSPINYIGAAGHRRIFLAVLILIGFTAVIAQIVLMRELLIVFQGNEMSLGWMLASWLLWTAIGSGVLGRVAARTQQPHRLVAALQVLVAISFPSAVFLGRASREAFQTVPGEVLGPGPTVLTCFLVLSVFCMVSGGLFAAVVNFMPKRLVRRPG